MDGVGVENRDEGDDAGGSGGWFEEEEEEEEHQRVGAAAASDNFEIGLKAGDLLAAIARPKDTVTRE